MSILTNTAGSLTFYALITSNNSLKTASIKYEIEIEDIEPPLEDSKVTLESSLKSEIKLDVIINEAGELEDSSVIFYQSPAAKYEG
mgnify:CR=1 FL=1